MPLTTRRSSTRGTPWANGKYGFRRDICALLSKNSSLITCSLKRSFESNRKLIRKEFNRS